MRYIFFFDLDGTLCPLAGPTPQEAVRTLRQLEEQDCAVVLCSGKPTYYLSGFARQLNLQSPLLIGENGLMMQIGIDLPPEDYILLPTTEIREKFRAFERLLLQEIGDEIWLQPNCVAVTPFFRREEGREIVRAMIESHPELLPPDAITVFEMVDCFDIVPRGYDKGHGVRSMLQRLEMTREQAIAIGDGPNDQAMFDACDYAISIKNPAHKNIDYYANDLTDALDHITKHFIP